MGVVDIDMCVSSRLTEELAWAVDKRLRVISTIMLFKEQYKSTKKLKGFKTILYVLLCGP